MRKWRPFSTLALRTGKSGERDIRHKHSLRGSFQCEAMVREYQILNRMSDGRNERGVG
jgi:hypothetical protein